MRTVEHGEGESIDFGPRGVTMVRWSSINELPQIRTSYDSAGLDELAESLLVEGGNARATEDFELLKPLLVGSHSVGSARRYIAEHGEYNRILEKDQVDVQDLYRDTEGRINILVDGHRRSRAIGITAQRHMLAAEAVRVSAYVRQDPPFALANSWQYKANIEERTSAADEARAIALHYNFIKSTEHRVPTYAEMARHFGCGETKVGQAIQFDELPDVIQDYAMAGSLSFGTVLQLRPLYGAYVEYHTQVNDGSGSLAERATRDLRDFCDRYLSKVLEQKSDEKVGRLIQNTIENVRGQTAFHLEPLIDVPEASREYRHTQSKRQLLKIAMATIRLSSWHRDLTDRDVEELSRILAGVADDRRQEAASRLNFGETDVA